MSFLAEVTPDRVVANPTAVARGNRGAVLAAARDATPGGIVIHNHPSGCTEPSDTDLIVAGRLHDEGLGSAIVDNGAANFYVVVEPPQPRRIEPLDPDALEELLAPGGPLSALPGYENRTGQREMLRFVTERFNEGGTGLVEAGTGTGKSMAYLVPAARWAARNKERTVVSTNTINLQEQLVGKDIALAEELLGEKVHWALVKGRANYVSIRRAKLAAQSAADLFADDRSQETRAVLEWLESTEDGSRGDLPFTPSREVWDEVRSDGDACLGSKCPHFQECHYQRSRRAAAAADLLVVNHALFFSDLAVRIATENYREAAVLPSYKRVVFDEAHHLEDAATTHLGMETTRAGLYAALSRLDRGGTDKGVLAALLKTVRQADGGLAVGNWLQEQLKTKTGRRLHAAREALDEFFGMIEPWVLAQGGQGAVRLGAAPGREPAEDAGVGESLTRALAAIKDLRRELDLLHGALEDEDRLGEAVQGRILDLQGCERRLEVGADALCRCLLAGDGEGDWVRWLEPRRSAMSRGRPPVLNLAFAAAPVDPGPLLAEHLFDTVGTAVLTSATMTANGSFAYVRGRLGLASRTPAVAEAVMGSPFDYASQSRIVVPSGLPSPGGGRARADANHRATAGVVHDTASITGGGLFVLFTSFSALRAVAAALRAMGDARFRWPLFVHGEGRRSRLLQGFTEAGDGVLLGTASFWEGVDVPGRPLRALVLHKLPFRVPSDPLVEARSEALEARGRNAFAEFMVPDAAIRLKQGVGRLIRRRTDRGAVVLLDDRVLVKRYGKAILDTLPPMPRITGPWEEARAQVARFYDSQPDEHA